MLTLDELCNIYTMLSEAQIPERLPVRYIIQSKTDIWPIPRLAVHDCKRTLGGWLITMTCGRIIEVPSMAVVDIVEYEEK